MYRIWNYTHEVHNECVLVSTFLSHHDKFVYLCTHEHSFYFFLAGLRKRPTLQFDLVVHKVKEPTMTETTTHSISTFYFTKELYNFKNEPKTSKIFTSILKNLEKPRTISTFLGYGQVLKKQSNAKGLARVSSRHLRSWRSALNKFLPRWDTFTFLVNVNVFK